MRPDHPDTNELHGDKCQSGITKKLRGEILGPLMDIHLLPLLGLFCYYPVLSEARETRRNRYR
jgi:hypothetical protein